MKIRAFLSAILVAGIAVAANPWTFDVEQNVDTKQNFSREFARGDSWNISPRAVDDGAPRAWPTNAVFNFFWQRPGMGATNWWVSTNVTWPVYHDVIIATTTPVITSYITNLTVVTYPTTNSVGVTNYYSTTNLFTTYINSYTTTNIVDTGRVTAAWNATMDAGSPTYNWFIGEFEGSAPNYWVNGTITFKNAPGYGGTWTRNPMFYPWATTNWVTNLFFQLQGYALWVTTNGAAPGYYLLKSPNSPP